MCRLIARTINFYSGIISETLVIFHLEEIVTYKFKNGIQPATDNVSSSFIYKARSSPSPPALMTLVPCPHLTTTALNHPIAPSSTAGGRQLPLPSIIYPKHEVTMIEMLLKKKRKGRLAHRSSRGERHRGWPRTA